ncbi:MAG: hypothetical protein RRB22_04885 [Gammaproteobacteria bacterium]|nr:hypothetical protein [Gammaproteobacteria bacterium]
MRDIELQPTSTAHWHELVCEAEHRSHRHLGEEVQSYLVFLLQRFLCKPEIAARILALDYLNGIRSSGHRQIEKLREVGDICLLYAGFFPQQARARLVNSNYFIDLGIGAYYQLHHNTPHHQGHLYEHLYESFVPAMDVLQSIRQLGDEQPLYDALTAYELWEHTGSSQAENRLQQVTQATPIKGSGRQRH